MTPEQPVGLIVALLLKNKDEAGRDDAAMDLGAYDEPVAEQALIQVASDPETEAMVVRSCGESLVEIWVRQDRLPEEVLPSLRPEALSEITGYRDWYKGKDQTRRVLAEIRKVLWEKWDPIGVNDMPAAFGEYDDYANGVFALLRRDASDTEIADYLRRLATENMGVGEPSRERIGAVLEALRAIDLQKLQLPVG